MRVLILGAGGFLGRHVSDLLGRQPGFEVTQAPGSQVTDLSAAPPAVWDRLLRDSEPDAVVNCAGRTHGSFADLTRANVTLVQRLIRAVQARPSPPRIVHLGSAAEYGPQARMVSETTPTFPAGPYGESKLAGTQALLGVHPGLPVTVLRVCNPVGAGQGAQTLTGSAARQFWEALHGYAAGVEFGDLSPARDFIDARDVARAVETVLLHAPAEPLLNVGRGEAVPARTLVHTLASIARYPGEIGEQASGSSRSAAVTWQQADISRLQQLGWTPAYTLDHALDALWRDVDTTSALRRQSA